MLHGSRLFSSACWIYVPILFAHERVGSVPLAKRFQETLAFWNIIHIKPRRGLAVADADRAGTAWQYFEEVFVGRVISDRKDKIMDG